MAQNSQSHADGARAEERRRSRRFLALGLLLATGLFCGVVIGVMLATRLAEGAVPLDQSALDARQQELQHDPGNQEAREALRRQDAGARREYLTNRRRIEIGALLLVAGLAAVVACARWYAALDPRRPVAGDVTEREDPQRWFGMRRRRVAGVAAGAAGLLVITALLAVAGGLRYWGEDRPGPVENGGAVTPPETTFTQNWPRFRGPGGAGRVPAGDWPREWDAASNRNMLWKTPVPLPGKGSPVVWGDRIFLTGADRDRREVMCFERATGKLLWRTAVPHQGRSGDQDDLDYVEDMGTGYAAPTPTTDGERVYALFATADLVAVDFSGGIAWSRNLGAPENVYGIASSPVFHDGRLFVQFDRGVDAEEALSEIMARDPKTGDVQWSEKRPVPNSWSTPILAETETGDELITCAAPWVISYDPGNGIELWRARGLSGDVGASPVYADEVVYVTTQYATAMAVRTGGVGDVTETNVLWTNEDGALSDAASPACDGKLFLQVHSSGVLTCHDVGSGEVLWEKELEGPFWASPTLVGRLVYLPSENGTTYMFELAREYREVSSATLGEAVFATPAFADLEIYIRGEKHLFAIGRPRR